VHRWHRRRLGLEQRSASGRQHYRIDKPIHIDLSYITLTAEESLRVVGYASGKANTKALIPLKGMLGDAQRFTTTICISASNQAVVWATPHKNQSSYIGGSSTSSTSARPPR
jgi:hypothetical protein